MGRDGLRIGSGRRLSRESAGLRYEERSGLFGVGRRRKDALLPPYVRTFSVPTGRFPIPTQSTPKILGTSGSAYRVSIAMRMEVFCPCELKKLLFPVSRLRGE